MPQTTATPVTTSPLANTTAAPVAAPLTVYKGTKSEKQPDLECYNKDCKKLDLKLLPYTLSLQLNTNQYPTSQNKLMYSSICLKGKAKLLPILYVKEQ